MNKARILIADDSAIVRSLLVEALTNDSDFEVWEARDGVEALDKSLELNPDLILLDLAMPRKNGMEVASILRTTSPTIKIVIFTMYPESISRPLASALGVDLVLSKPDGMNQVVKSVKTLLA
jgi:DNA-binding NarL/FixJ family response regulator